MGREGLDGDDYGGIWIPASAHAFEGIQVTMVAYGSPPLPILKEGIGGEGILG